MPEINNIVIVEDGVEATFTAQEEEKLLIEVQIVQIKDNEYELFMQAVAYDGLDSDVFLYDKENDTFTIREVGKDGKYIEPGPLEPVSYYIGYFKTMEDALKFAEETVKKIKEIREIVRENVKRERKRLYFVV